MKILLLNSDLAKNRGDRVITEGIVQLIRETYPDATITALSEEAVRDRDWFGIEFLPMGSDSLNPWHWITLARAAGQADRIFWGGGELLKDYTNQLGLWYWCIKIIWLRLFNSSIYGAYQGIGPTSSPLSRRIICFVVNRTKHFILRDAESYKKLQSWGVDAEKLTASIDPAILPETTPLSTEDFDTLHEFGLSKEFLDDFVAIAPRDWFHYRKGQVLPYRWRAKLPGNTVDPRNRQYRQRLINLANLALKRTERVLLLPMHMGEDIALCQEIAAATESPERVFVADKDTLPPALLRKVLATARLMIGFRLHATIIATSASTPSLNIYYVDKGRIYFDQIRQSSNAYPIEAVLDDDFDTDIALKVDELLQSQDKCRQDLQNAMQRLRFDARQSFKKLNV
ncbi:MAG: hypothetical protein HKN35_04195 [Woeseia sp.]|nr:polysaccharide pyruvyl transferase family protein [Woeseia sp.]MBT8096358.1 polysaccharide pyruvyl transferase family protein [Woeseia sp.]NNE60069.1 hypothetical protein [Woeseia sp.]NNL54984.1 hypothetical protein [Woeseia sp.]